VTLRLCLHGFTGSPQSWDFLARANTDAVIAPALLGHAGVDVPESVSRFEDEVDRLAAFANGEPVHLIGYSLGARLALGIALRHPSLVARLSLLSGHPGLASEPERTLRRAADAAWCELLQTQGVAAFVDAWQAQPLWASQARLPAATREQKRQERLQHTALGLRRSLRVTGLAEMPNFLPLLPQIRVPTDVVAGELDSKFCELARVLARGLEHGRLAIIPDTGHDLLLEQPGLITELIRGT